MIRILEELQRLLDDCHGFFKASGRVSGDEGSRIVEGVLVALVRNHFNQNRHGGMTLSQIIDELITLPSFNNLPDGALSLILNTLVLRSDKELMTHAREAISREWKEVDDNFLNRDEAFRKGVKAVNTTIRECIRNGVFPPSPRPERGLSLVVSFEYPQAFHEVLRTHLMPIRAKLFETCQHHFTIVNVGTEIPANEVDNIRRANENLIRQDRDLYKSLQSVRHGAEIYPDVRLLPDGSIYLLGTGSLEIIRELGFRLMDRILPQDRESVRRERQPGLVHTVFARVIQELNGTDINQLTGTYDELQRNGQSPISLNNVRLGFITFTDQKAMLPPQFDEI